MSCDKEVRGRSSRKPINVLSIECLELVLPCNIIELKPGKVILSGPHTVHFLQEHLYLQVLKLTKDFVTVSLLRRPLQREYRDPGSALRFCITAIFINEPPKCVDMSHDSDGVSVHYRTESFLKTICAVRNPDKQFHLKVVVKLVEFDSLSNQRRQHYEHLLSMKTKEFMSSRETQEDMAYLLRRPTVAGIFTGRESELIAATKLSTILRTAYFSRELAEYFRAKENKSVYMPEMNSPVILNYILKGTLESISHTELFVLYSRSHVLGFKYLQAVTLEHILEVMKDVDVVAAATRVASQLGDEALFDFVADVFDMHFDQVVNSACWKWMKKMMPLKTKTILHEVIFRRCHLKKSP